RILPDRPCIKRRSLVLSDIVGAFVSIAGNTDLGITFGLGKCVLPFSGQSSGAARWWSDNEVSRSSVDSRTRLDGPRLRRRVEAERIVLLPHPLGSRLVVEGIDRLTGNRIVVDRPVLGPTYNLADKRDEQLALVATLEAKLTTQVAELSKLLSTEAGHTAAD